MSALQSGVVKNPQDLNAVVWLETDLPRDGLAAVNGTISLQPRCHRRRVLERRATFGEQIQDREWWPRRQSPETGEVRRCQEQCPHGALFLGGIQRAMRQVRP